MGWTGFRAKAAGVVLGLLLAGCAVDTPFQPLPSEPWPAMQQRYLDWSAARPGWTRLPSGLQYRREGAANPAGAVPTPDAVVTVQCEGHLVDGRLFFATTPDKPLTAPLGKLIKGWQEGLRMMHAGESWQFVLPAPLAYGEKGWNSTSPATPSIPPGTTLIFGIKLLAVTPPAQEH